MTVRLLHFVVQPVLVMDDGENLAAAPSVLASTLTLAGLRDLVDNWPDHLAAIEAQITAGPADSPAR